MGQKVNPIGLRLAINRDWKSKWYSDVDYRNFIIEDIHIREYIKKELFNAGLPRVDIERSGDKPRIIIYAGRPGLIIGKKGSEIDRFKEKIEKFARQNFIIDIKEVRRPEIDAQLVAESIASQISRRVSFRRAMKKCVSTAIQFGAMGVRVSCAGRLADADMARKEWYREGRVPLHTFRADIDYGFTKAQTKYGVIGVKVWIYKGERQDIGRSGSARYASTKKI